MIDIENFTAMMESLLAQFEEDMKRTVRTMVIRAKEQLAEMQSNTEARNTQALAEVTTQRAALEQEVATGRRRAALAEEIAAMQQVERAQDSRVTLNVGGVRYETSITTLRSTPGTMLDAMFSGRHAMDPDSDGAHFLDRDGGHFKYVLEYLRDGVSVLQEAADDVCLLRALKREFDYFAIELELQPSSQTVYAVGGKGEWGDNSHLSSTERYDPAPETWTELQSMSIGKQLVGACAVEGKLYVTGGLAAGCVTLATVDRYDPVTDTWDSAVTPMPATRFGHCACAVQGCVYVMGGWDPAGEVQRTCWRYDAAGNTWSVMEPMPLCVGYFAACVLGADIYIMGGYGTDVRVRNNVYRYSTEANEWTDLAPMPERKSELAACALHGMVYAVGGFTDDIGCLSTMHKYNPATNSWAEVASMPTSRSELSVFVLNDCLYAAGGWVEDESNTAEVEQYDPSTDSWTMAHPMCTTRQMFGMCTVEQEGEEVDLFDAMIARAT